MKKFSKIGKRVLAFFLVALMNINAYATTASNDGSAFITKAEFDDKVKLFNDNMDTYQSGLNAKIDQAIASYLGALSGTAKSEEPFYDGLGGVAMIMNSDNINDLKIGKAGYSLNFTNTYISTNGTSGEVHMSLQMTRKADDDRRYEMYMIDANKQLMLCSDEVELNMTKNTSAYMATTWAAFPDPGANYTGQIRWHGDIYGGKAEVVDEHSSSTSEAAAKTYALAFGKKGWGMVTGTGLNWSSCRGLKSNELSWSYEDKNLDGKVITVFDTGVNKNKLWVKYLSDNKQMLDTFIEENTELTDDPQYDKYDKSKQYKWETPSSAGITTQGSGYAVYKRTGVTSTEPGYRYQNSTNWTTVGSYNSTTTPTNSAREFIEPVFKLNEEYSKNIKNLSATEAVKKKFNPNNDSDKFQGYITEGIPISTFDKRSTATFKIDTAAAGGSSATNTVVGFKVEPFGASEVLENLTNDTKITLTVDGAVQANDYCEIAPGEHEIVVEIDPGLATLPLYFKIGYPKTVTTSIRGKFTLPKTFTKQSK